MIRVVHNQYQPIEVHITPTLIKTYQEQCFKHLFIHHTHHTVLNSTWDVCVSDAEGDVADQQVAGGSRHQPHNADYLWTGAAGWCHARLMPLYCWCNI